MPRPYRIAVNLEWTSRCNARCSMCPRTAIRNPETMDKQTFERVLERIDPVDVFRGVIAGYGEPTIHPHFLEYVDAIRAHPVSFDLVSNGQKLDRDALQRIDGAVGALLISFSSVDPDVYRRVHVGLDHAKVMENIQRAVRTFASTAVGISLSPLPECLETLPATIEWLRGAGVAALTMSPTLYNRAGSLDTDVAATTERLREIIDRYDLHSQELDFIPSAWDIFEQWRKNRFGCVARNSDVLIAASGHYMYCYNDVAHGHPLGHVRDMDLRDALRARERLGPISALCDGCNMRNRYGLKEIVGVAFNYAKGRRTQAS